MTQLIDSKDISPVTLSLELERAVVDHVLEDDKSIYVTEFGFAYWLHVHEDSGLISFRTHTNFRSSVTRIQRLELCNQLNEENFMITAFARGERLWVDHSLSFRDGLVRETFIRGCRNFARTIEKALGEIDPKHESVLKPGQTEFQND